MTANTPPPEGIISSVKQDTVHWPAKALRVTLVDSNGNEITESIGLPVKRAIERKTGTITVSGGTGTVAIADVNFSSLYLGVQGPNSNETFTIQIVDTATGVELELVQARSGDNGCARSKSLGLPLFDITINVTSASADGTYTYLLLGA